MALRRKNAASAALGKRCDTSRSTDDSKLFVLTGGYHAQSSRKSIFSLLHVGMSAVIAFHHN
jgi:hypothetical protein